MALIVQKYGGSSLATPRHIQRAAQRIRELKASGSDVVVVVSAMGRMTDHLIALAKKTVKVPPQRELDMLMTAGERISMSLLAMALHDAGVPAISFTGSQGGILTSSDHTEARILDIRGHRIREELDKKKVVIIAGFQGVSQEKEITTLGRGGSDTTAVALAAALGAERCDILTDVDGLFTADPRIVKTARLIPHCSYDEALELASLGAKMHSRSVEVAKRFKVRVHIASSADAARPGTILSDLDPQEGNSMESTVIRGIATREGYHFLRAQVSLEKLCDAIRGLRLPLRFFASAGDELRFVCEKERVDALKTRLTERSIPFEDTPKVSLISAVGEGLSSAPDELPRFLETIREAGAECHLVCANSLSMTAVVATDKKDAVAKSLHQKLVELN